MESEAPITGQPSCTDPAKSNRGNFTQRAQASDTGLRPGGNLNAPLAPENRDLRGTYTAGHGANSGLVGPRLLPTHKLGERVRQREKPEDGLL